MRKAAHLLWIVLLLLAVASCGDESSRIHGTDGGGVVLVITDFNGLPTRVSVNNTVNTTLQVTIETITIRNTAKEPNAPITELMDVEMQSYEITFSRADTGTRLPPALVRGILGTAPINGTEIYFNLPLLSAEQLLNAPLSDLLVENGAFDKETGSQVIILNLALRFFGRTVSGKEVDTSPALFTIEFVP